MEHQVVDFYSCSRVYGYNQKTRQNSKTIGWATGCPCGIIIETSYNNLKAHKTKVDKHIKGAN